MKKIILRFRVKDRQFFHDIKKRVKTVETRAATKRFRDIETGDIIIFICGKDKLKMTAKKARHFKSIDSVIKKVDFKKIMPRVKNITELKRIYYGFPGYREKIKKLGLIAIEF